MVGRLCASSLVLLLVTGCGSGLVSVNAQSVFRGPGIVLRYSRSLYVSNRPFDAITNPMQRFVLATYPLAADQPNLAGDYSPPPRGVIAELLEEVPSGDTDFQAPPRPRAFTLPPQQSRLETLGPRWAEIPFRDHGRDFMLFIGVGDAAPATTVAEVLKALDRLQVATPPRSVSDA
jgi:hypothetical protein